MGLFPNTFGVVGNAAAGTGAGGYFTGGTTALRTLGGMQLTGIGEAAGRVLTSDASGNATWQTNSYSFAINSFFGPIAVPAGPPVTITSWSNISYENGTAGNYNNVTGEYTIPVTGVYNVNASIRWNTFAAGYVLMELDNNGIFTGMDGTGTAGNNVISTNINTDMSFTAGDKIKIRLFNSTGGAISTYNNPANRFTVHLVHK